MATTPTYGAIATTPAQQAQNRSNLQSSLSALGAQSTVQNGNVVVTQTSPGGGSNPSFNGGSYVKNADGSLSAATLMPAETKTGLSAPPGVNGIDTGQPSPTTTTINPPNNGKVDAFNTQFMKDHPEYGYGAFTGDPNGQPNPTTETPEIKARYQTGLTASKTNGGQAPDNAGLANSTIQADLPPQKYEPPQQTQTELDKAISTYTKLAAEFLSPDNQRISLVDEYRAMSKELGISDLKSELMDINRIMDGNEDMIRSEITAAGGFATDGQVQAMTIARNKSLLKKGQYLQDQITSAKDELGTMMQLSSQDRQFAEQRMQSGLSIFGKMVDIQMSYHKAAQDNYNTIVSKQGYDGLLAMTGNDPFNIELAEKTLGLQSGGLSSLARLSAQDRATKASEDSLDRTYKQAQINKINYDMTGGGTGIDEKTMGKIQSSPEYKVINTVMPSIQALKSYKDAINENGTTEWFGAGSGTLSGTYGNALATWKSLAQLGALSGADFALAENAVPKPGLFQTKASMNAKLNASINNAIQQTESLTKRLGQNYPVASNLLNHQLDDMYVTAYPDEYTVGPDGLVYKIK